jgi:Sigma-70 region 3
MVVSDLRAELITAVEQLLIASEASRQVTLDELGDAVGALSVSYADIDAMISLLEARGRRVVAPAELKGEQLLGSVLKTLRTLRPALGRRPTHEEIAKDAGLSVDEVRHALMLAQVMQRG